MILAVISSLLVAGWFTATTDGARVALYRHGQWMDADAAFAGTALDGTPPPRRPRRAVVATGRLTPPVSTHPTSVDP